MQYCAWIMPHPYSQILTPLKIMRILPVGQDLAHRSKGHHLQEMHGEWDPKGQDSQVGIYFRLRD